MKLRKSSFVQLISKGEDKYIIFNSYYGNLMKINQKTADLINPELFTTLPRMWLKAT